LISFPVIETSPSTDLQLKFTRCADRNLRLQSAWKHTKLTVF